MITYTFKNENNEEGILISVKDRTIVKTGHEIEFTLNRMEENEALLEKQKIEAQGVIENRKAMLSNIVEHHPFVLTLSEEDRNTVYMYRQAELEVSPYENQLEQIERMLEKSAVEKEEIKKQLDING